jgi:MtN3 and saliva related transmembrane protein
MYFKAGNNIMEISQFIGLAAGTITTVSFLPQLIRTARTRSSRDLSLGMVCLFVTGIILWLVYGIMTHALPVICANTVTLVLAAVLLFLIIKYRT